MDEQVAEIVRYIESISLSPRTLAFPQTPVKTRKDVQMDFVDKKLPYTCTSGSTGAPVYVQKTVHDKVWHTATSVLELLWKKWDPSKTVVCITAAVQTAQCFPWNTNTILFGDKVGKCYTLPVNQPRMRQCIDQIRPDYIHTYPSILRQLGSDLNIESKTLGEQGACSYSSEEFGTIGLTCPDNGNVYHIMPNLLVEIDSESNLIITDTFSTRFVRYMIGDKGEFATCSCPRVGLQTISKNVLGRVRNMVKINGELQWPRFGTISIRDIEPCIERVQAIQIDDSTIKLKIMGKVSPKHYKAIRKLVKTSLGFPFTVLVEHVEAFPPGKFEEFIRVAA